MKTVTLMIVMLWLLSVGCATDSSEGKTGRTPEQDTAKPIEWKESIEVETPELIRILEEEDIAETGTSHSGRISIGLKDGRGYYGKYVRAQAGKYAEDERCFDACGLVGRIQKHRAPEERWPSVSE